MSTKDEAKIRERNARYSREYRARKRAEAAAAAREASHAGGGGMRQSVEEAIAAMRWLAASDAATVMQAKLLASLVDTAEATGDVRLALRGHSLLAGVLSELGGTPRVRMQLEVRARRLSDAVDRSAEAAAIAASPNVTPIASGRPVPRNR